MGLFLMFLLYSTDLLVHSYSVLAIIVLKLVLKSSNVFPLSLIILFEEFCLFVCLFLHFIGLLQFCISFKTSLF